MPHRSPIPGLKLVFGKPEPRHAGATLVSRRTKRIFGAVLVGVVLINVVVLLFRIGHRANAAPTMVLPLPAASFPAATPSPSGSLSLRRTVRQTTKPKATKASTGPAHVLLGPDNLQAALSTYCQWSYGGRTMAYPTRDGWQCAQYFGRSQAIDMDAACRALYDARAWAYLADDTDPQSWRCYRDSP